MTYNMVKHFATAAFIAAVTVFAWMFRYEPIIISTNSIQATLVFDRWTHNVCAVGVSVPDGRICGLSQIASLSSSEKVALDRIQRFKAAGFSDKEIEDFVKEKLDK